MSAVCFIRKHENDAPEGMLFCASFGLKGRGKRSTIREGSRVLGYLQFFWGVRDFEMSFEYASAVSEKFDLMQAFDESSAIWNFRIARMTEINPKSTFNHLPMNQKAFIFSIPIVLAVLLLGGWLVLRVQKSVQNVPKEPIDQGKQKEMAVKTEKEVISQKYDFGNDLDIVQWKTYKSEKLGLTIKYPQSWSVVVLENEKAGIALRSPAYVPIKSGEVTYDGEIYVNSIPNPKSLSIKNLYETFDDTSRFWFSQFPYEELTITGRKSIHFSGIDELMISNTGNMITDKREEFIVQGNKKVFYFSFSYLKENKNSTISEIFRRIVENSHPF